MEMPLGASICQEALEGNVCSADENRRCENRSEQMPAGGSTSPVCLFDRGNSARYLVGRITWKGSSAWSPSRYQAVARVCREEK
jgi:hypothetical protein